MTKIDYKDPPIVEAVCELRFQEPGDWDITAVPKFFEHIKNSYPAKPKPFQEQQVEIQPSGYLVKQVTNKTQFANEEKGETVSVASTLLSVSDLPQYSGWKKFRVRVKSAVSNFLSVIEKVQVSRIGIRYINRIDFNESEGVLENLDKYFTCIPPLAKGLPSVIANFQGMTELRFDEEPSCSCRINFSKGAEEDERKDVSIFLDIDVGQTLKSPFELTKATVDDIMVLIDKNRTRERDVFEALITDESRKKFNASK